MQYISSDTNVWIDFVSIEKTELPFLLPYTYLMFSEAIEEELVYPNGIADKLLGCGLKKTELSDEEYELAGKYAEQHPQLSKFDCIALAIAKVRNILLLTGEKRLRETAKVEKVPVKGTLAILDELRDGEHIADEIYADCIKLLINAASTGIVRLPKEELCKRQRVAAKK